MSPGRRKPSNKEFCYCKCDRHDHDCCAGICPRCNRPIALGYADRHFEKCTLDLVRPEKVDIKEFRDQPPKKE